jgi:transposase
VLCAAGCGLWQQQRALDKLLVLVQPADELACFPCCPALAVCRPPAQHAIHWQQGRG